MSHTQDLPGFEDGRTSRRIYTQIGEGTFLEMPELAPKPDLITHWSIVARKAHCQQTKDKRQEVDQQCWHKVCKREKLHTAISNREDQDGALEQNLTV